MEEKHNQSEAEEWAESLAALRALSEEVNAGLLALSKNDLEQFEARVAAQQKICDSLRSSRLFDREKLKNLAADLKQAAAAAMLVQPELENPSAKLAAIHKDLVHLNRVYATVVVRAQKFFSALLALHTAGGRGYSKDGKTVTAEHTWSCEA
jgi:hypothetical protein